MRASRSPDGATWTPIPGSEVVFPALGEANLVGLASAVLPGGSSVEEGRFDGLSVPVTATTTEFQSCPDGWSCRDVVTGSSSGAGMSWVKPPVIGVVGPYGGGIGGTSDTFRFASTRLPADPPYASAFSARITNNGYSFASYAISGLMLRASLQPDAPFYGVFFKGQALVVEWRSKAGGEAKIVYDATKPAATLPLFLRVDREWRAASPDFLARPSRLPSVSADGNSVAYWNGLNEGAAVVGQILLRDRSIGTTSVLRRGTSQGAVTPPVISADGNWVAWGEGARPGKRDETLYPAAARAIAVWQRVSGQVSLPNLCPLAHGEYLASQPSLSADGRYLAFVTPQDCTGSDKDGRADVYVADLRNPGSNPELISVHQGGIGANYAAARPAISGDGRWVAFEAYDVQGEVFVARPDVYLRDRGAPLGTGPSTTKISVDPSGKPADGPSGDPSISSDGTVVAFSSQAHNLVAGDAAAASDVYVWRLGTTPAILRASVGATGKDGSYAGRISGDGKAVAFASSSARLVGRDANGVADVFVRYLEEPAATALVSLAPSGGGNGQSMDPAIDGAGNTVAFASDASNLVDGDTNRVSDVFVWTRPAAVTISPSVGSPGIVAIVEGRGFPAGAPIDLAWSAGLQPRALTPIVADASGAFEAQALVVPGDRVFGPRELVATTAKPVGSPPQTVSGRAPFLVVQHTYGPPASEIWRRLWGSERPFFQR